MYGQGDLTPVQVKYLGDSYCTSMNQCDVGQGDCDSDNDCKTGLKCGQRNNFEKLAGLTGLNNVNDTAGNGDYCYDPDYHKKSKIDRNANMVTITSLPGGSTPCTTEAMGSDPIPGTAKLCYC